MLKARRSGLLAGVAVVVALLISACGSTTGSTSTPTTTASNSTSGVNCVSGSIVAAGSTALQPLVTKVAADYHNACPGATITVQGGGSGTGRSDVEAGSVAIGDSDTPVAAGTMTDLVDHQVAVVIFGVIVNPDTGVTNLTTAQLQSIYTGKVTNWNQVGGANLPIVVVSRPASSGTKATFAQYVLGETETITGPSHLVSDTTGVVVQEVSQTAGAIGYAASGQVSAGSAKIISIDGNAPTAANVESNTYKFWNIEHMYTKGAATGLTAAFLSYFNSDTAHADEAAQQFVALTSMQANAITAHNAVPKPS